MSYVLLFTHRSEKRVAESAKHVIVRLGLYALRHSVRDPPQHQGLILLIAHDSELVAGGDIPALLLYRDNPKNQR